LPTTVFLDTGPLSLITHPRDEHREEARQRLLVLLESGASAVLPEIVDYEHRRKLLHLESLGSLRHLDALKETISYAPLTSGVMLRAARLWAEARKRGLPTASERALDIDVILAAQALEFRDNEDEVIVATMNPRHLSRFVNTRNWQEIEPQTQS
jgi:predicted nucleic acid-binding protein